MGFFSFTFLQRLLETFRLNFSNHTVQAAAAPHRPRYHADKDDEGADFLFLKKQGDQRQPLPKGEEEEEEEMDWAEEEDTSNDDEEDYDEDEDYENDDNDDDDNDVD